MKNITDNIHHKINEISGFRINYVDLSEKSIILKEYKIGKEMTKIKKLFAIYNNNRIAFNPFVLGTVYSHRGKIEM